MITVLPPITKFELNRLAHARAQEYILPGSPAGKSGHSQLSQAARDCFNSSWSELDVDQMRSIYDFMERFRRLPFSSADLTGFK